MEEALVEMLMLFLGGFLAIGLILFFLYGVLWVLNKFLG